MIDFGSEVMNKLIELLKTDNINALYLLKTSLNADIGKKLNEVLPLLKNLKFFGLSSSDHDNNYITDICTGIGKNNSLKVVYLQKLPLTDQKLTELGNLVKENKSLKIFKYFKYDDI